MFCVCLHIKKSPYILRCGNFERKCENLKTEQTVCSPEYWWGKGGQLYCHFFKTTNKSLSYVVMSLASTQKRLTEVALQSFIIA